MLQGAIIVLGHSRVEHLRHCLNAVASANRRQNLPLAVVIDEGNDEIQALVENARPSVAIRLKADNDSAARTRIMRSLSHGLSWAFDIVNADYVVVVEDDIVISEDFFAFVEACFEKFGNCSFFRGVNGFGLSLRPVDAPSGEVEVNRLNYGVGWGWSIPRRTYSKILPLFKLKGDYHVWDALIEPYIRTGYVVNPRTSKVRNIGFDSSASHTSLEADAAVGHELEASFVSGEISKHKRIVLKTSDAGFRWRGDAIALDALAVRHRLLTVAAGLALWHVHKLRLSLEERGTRSAILIAILRLLRRQALPALGRKSGSRGPFDPRPPKNPAPPSG